MLYCASGKTRHGYFPDCSTISCSYNLICSFLPGRLRRLKKEVASLVCCPKLTNLNKITTIKATFTSQLVSSSRYQIRPQICLELGLGLVAIHAGFERRNATSRSHSARLAARGKSFATVMMPNQNLCKENAAGRKLWRPPKQDLSGKVQKRHTN